MERVGHFSVHATGQVDSGTRFAFNWVEQEYECARNRLLHLASMNSTESALLCFVFNKTGKRSRRNRGQRSVDGLRESGVCRVVASETVRRNVMAICRHIFALMATLIFGPLKWSQWPSLAISISNWRWPEETPTWHQYRAFRLNLKYQMCYCQKYTINWIVT